MDGERERERDRERERNRETKRETQRERDISSPASILSARSPAPDSAEYTCERAQPFLFFFSLLSSLELSDTKVYEP